jgi:lysine 6-dehydrogenase
VRALLVGAAGMVGRAAAQALISRGRFDEVVLADIRADAIPDIADRVALDISDADALRHALSGMDVVLNCTTYHYGIVMLEGAIASGVGYVDLGGLHNTPRQLLLDDAAREAGISAVIGCGATPGVSNVLARAASEALGEVSEVDIAFASYRDLAPSPGLLDTVLDEFRPDVDRYYWSEGALVRVEPFSGEAVVRFPTPVDNATVFYVPHSENHTLPQSLVGVRRVSVRGTWRPPDMALLRALARSGLTSSTPLQVDGIAVKPLEVLRAALIEAHRPSDEPCCFYVKVTAHTAGGERWERTASHPLTWGSEATGKMTGIPAAIGAEFVAQGYTPKGVVAPDVAFSMEAFLDEAASEGIAVAA